jgi:hypothetical protein
VRACGDTCGTIYVAGQLWRSATPCGMYQAVPAMSYKIYEFDAAIVRRPAPTVTAGLRAVDQGDPTYEGVSGEHDAYVAALRDAGVQVEVLEPLAAFPDSIFVEDPALVFTIGAILLRPGSASREGEAELIGPVLEQHFERVLRLPRGCVDGGDVLRTPGKVMIGLSTRTTREGAEALVECLAELGEAVSSSRRPTASSTSSLTARCSTMKRYSQPNGSPPPACFLVLGRSSCPRARRRLVTHCGSMAASSSARTTRVRLPCFVRRATSLCRCVRRRSGRSTLACPACRSAGTADLARSVRRACRAERCAPVHASKKLASLPDRISCRDIQDLLAEHLPQTIGRGRTLRHHAGRCRTSSRNSR